MRKTYIGIFTLDKSTGLFDALKAIKITYSECCSQTTVYTESLTLQCPCTMYTPIFLYTSRIDLLWINDFEFH